MSEIKHIVMDLLVKILVAFFHGFLIWTVWGIIGKLYGIMIPGFLECYYIAIVYEILFGRGLDKNEK